MFKHIALFATVAVLAGCATSHDTPTTDTPAQQAQPATQAQQAQPATGAQGADAATTAGVAAGSQMVADPLDDPASPLATRVIYFDFDSDQIRPEFRDVLRAHAQYIAARAQVSVTLEGHADERGSREYNVGLGDRRATAVRQILTLQGALPSQLQTVSYGEERPAARGSNEDAWRLNRRVELVYERR